MKKTVSLKENHEFRRLYHRGVSTAGKHVVIYCRRNKLGYNRLGLTVSAKLACAVKRNRIKRLFREAYRLNEDKFADGIDLVLVARVRAVGASYQEIEKSLLRALKDNKVGGSSDMKRLAAGDDPVLSPVYFSKQTALLPVYPDLLAVRDRGHREIRRDQGRLAGV